MRMIFPTLKLVCNKNYEVTLLVFYFLEHLIYFTRGVSSITRTLGLSCDKKEDIWNGNEIKIILETIKM